MKTYTNEEIIAKCSEIWHPISPYRDFKIVVHCNTPDVVIITIRQMYEYVELNLKHLLALAKFFETENINDSRYHSSGCETCDYGSSYEITLTIKPELTK